MNPLFADIKKEVLDKAKAANACADQYRRAAKAETEADLLQVINENLRWCIDKNVISHQLISTGVWTNKGRAVMIQKPYEFYKHRD